MEGNWKALETQIVDVLKCYKQNFRGESSGSSDHTDDKNAEMKSQGF